MASLNTTQTLKLYWHHVWLFPRYAIGVLVSIPLTVLVGTYLPPLIVADVLARLAHHNFQIHHPWASFGPILALYIILLIAGGLLWRVVDAFAWRLEASVLRSIAERVYSHLLDQSANFHANSFGGSLVSQTNKLMGSYIRFADTTMFQVIPLFSGLVFIGIILVGRAPLYVLLFMIFVIAYLIAAVLITRRVRQASAKQATAESKQTGYLADSVTNVMAIKSFAGGQYERASFSNITAHTQALTLDVMRASRRQMISISLMITSISGLALVMAVVGVVVFNANLATVYLIFSYTSTMTGLLFSFATTSLRNYNRSIGDAFDMVEILNTPPEVTDPVNPIKPRIKNGDIRFDNVSFTHAGAGEALFHDFSLDIPAGQKVGLVGHSGSGKTTFTRLLLRFSDIDSGAITIDNQNISDMTQDDLRKHIAYVPQEPIMFHRSLADNIRYGRFKADEKAVTQAAKAAHADEFIDHLPEGYETLVGERGIKLSGGQRQRIAIARAMLKDAPILLLDEATSALDSESEILIQDALWKLMEGRTAIVIAHRLSTIQKMDRIVVLEDGKIVEEGTHKKLLAKHGTYAKLWAHQSGGFIEE